ncbi:ribonuclease III [Hoylesella nanceiensis]|uniref:ribonuclease III n=1 Tax=Hoylesella nanceiensis TaxID=425941 RepID=UPI001CB5BFC1|nr:ribonuclease III [Hoylesella nanceiensis]MBF1428268.1 ribonuclease III [Hoylesella nanceiensis]MBF1437329.1 ribonuclease III [Hoylesella nanceiensis]
MLNSNFIDRIKLPFRKEKELYLSLYTILGFYPRNIELYQMALSHKSIHFKNKKGKPVNNERLEFLGDAILDAIVGDIVYKHFPGKREGFLTNTRSKLVQRETLNKIAQEIGLSRLIYSSGRNFSHNSYMAGNAFEALIGALYLDRGYNLCMRFMQEKILTKMVNIDTVAYKEVNFKSRLIEWAQKNKMNIAFNLLEQKKDDEGNPVFKYCVVIEGIKCNSASGFSKKESQQLASEETLEYIKKNTRFCDALFEAKKKRQEAEQNKETAQEQTVESTKNTTQPAQDEPLETTVITTTGKPKEEVVEMKEIDEFDLSDITANPKEPTQEEIIAAAEEAAFAGKE